MQVIGKTKKRKNTYSNTLNFDPSNIIDFPAYQPSNAFYILPPVEEISIEQFENFGMDRITGILNLFDN